MRTDAVVHFAARKAVAESVRQAAGLLRQQPRRAVQRLRGDAARIGCRRIVFSSSATVYGMPERLPIAEDAPLGATNPYGQTKLMGETVLRDLAASDARWQVATAALLQPGGRARQRPDRRRPARHAEQPDALRGAGGGRAAASTCRSSATTTTPPTAPACATTSMSCDLADGHVAALRYLFDADALADRQSRHRARLQRARGGARLCAGQRPRHCPTGSAPRRPGDVAACYADPTPRARSCWAGAPRSTWSACAPTAGAGSA